MKSLNRLLIFIVFSLVVFLLTSMVESSEKDPCKGISAPEVKHMLDNSKALAVHVLSSFEYEMQHISNSINIPVNKILKNKNKLPKDKKFPIIFYCMGHR